MKVLLVYSITAVVDIVEDDMSNAHITMPTPKTHSNHWVIGGDADTHKDAAKIATDHVLSWCQRQARKEMEDLGVTAAFSQSKGEA